MKRMILTAMLLSLLLVSCGRENGQNNTIDNAIESTVQTDTPADNIIGAQADAQTDTKTNTQTETSSEGSDAYILTFEASTIEGAPLTSECFADSKLTMINVWATYCNPCISEMPDLGEIAASYDKAEFQIIGIVSDVTEDAEEKMIDTARNLVEDTGANYPHLLLNESLYTNLVEMVDAVPTTFFVNRKGEVLGYAVGSQSKETWEELIDEILAEVE